MMEDMERDEPTPPPAFPVGPGVLLVASPSLADPHFTETVVLLLDVDDDGALGVVLNRPSPLPVATVLGEWSDFVAEPEVLFRGGPVGPEGALALAMLRDPADAPEGFSPVLGPIGLLDLDTPVEEVQESLVTLRLFAGYAGWDADQLESEIAEGAWDVVPAEPLDAFHDDTTDLWRAVLRRQPGELAWRSTRPADPDLN